MTDRRDERELADTLAVDTTQAEPPDAHPEAAPTPNEIGRYRLITRIGAGAMGEVWVAHDPQLDRKVAIKLVHPRVGQSPEVTARMLREARAMAKLSHRAVVAIHDAGDHAGQLFLAMEYVHGRSLGALLRERTPEERRDWRRWLAMMIDAGGGLAAAHEAGILHRDFKPDNVLVDDNGRVCVGDFGLASLDEAAQSRASRPVLDELTSQDLTVTGTLLGTPAYMSLEQLHGDDIDARADQFSFCVATYEALYGERPFAIPADERGNLAALLDSVERGTIKPAPVESQVPDRIRAALLRGLSPRARDRWPDMPSLLAELERSRAPAIARRSRWPIYAGVAALGVGSIVVAAQLLARDDAPSAPPPVSPAAVQREPRHLQSISMRALFALSPAGRLAVGTERVQVTDLAHPDRPTHVLPPPDNAGYIPWTDRVQFDGDEALYWSTSWFADVLHWRFGDGQPPRVVDRRRFPDQRWVGNLRSGDLVAAITAPESTSVFLQRSDGSRRAVAKLGTGRSLDLFVIAPGRERFAYVEPTDTYHGKLIAIEPETGREWRSGAIAGLTAVSWRDDGRLVYGTRESVGKVYEVALGDRSFTTPRTLHAIAGEWVGGVAANADRLVYSQLTTQSRPHVIGADRNHTRDFEPTEMNAALGWTASGACVLWSKTAGIEIRSDLYTATTPMRAALAGEPQNTTLAGTVVIVASRGFTGRSLVAIDLASPATAAEPRWRLDEGRAWLARCAGDTAPPCIIALATPGSDELDVRSLDPVTGAIGDASLYRGVFDDVAVHADGKRMLFVRSQPYGVTSTATEVGAGELRKFDIRLVTVRSVAYAGDDIVVGGTVGGNRYIVQRITSDNATTVITEGAAELLTNVRASPDGTSIAVLRRQSNADLFELPLAD